MIRHVPVRYRARAGFTLLEVMVALAILAIGLVTVMQLFAGALRLSRVDKGLTEAVLLAQQKMDELVLIEDLTDGYEESGEENGYSWTARADQLHSEGGTSGGREEEDMETAEFVQQIAEEDAVVPVYVYGLAVTVKWRFGESQNEREYVLETLKSLMFREELQ